MTDIVKGMVEAFYEGGGRPTSDRMRAALLFLAGNVNHDMVVSAAKAHEATPLEHGASAWRREAISSAIRAAAGEEGK